MHSRSRRDTLMLSADAYATALDLVHPAWLDDDPEIELIRVGLHEAAVDGRGDSLLELPSPLTTRLLDIADAASKRDDTHRGLRLLMRELLAST